MGDGTSIRAERQGKFYHHQFPIWPYTFYGPIPSAYYHPYYWPSYNRVYSNSIVGIQPYFTTDNIQGM